MKLILCPACESVASLSMGVGVTCHCGKSWGRYREDGVRAVIGGLAIPLAIREVELAAAVRNRPTGGQGEPFTAIVVSRACPTVVHQDTIEPAPWRQDGANVLEGWA